MKASSDIRRRAVAGAIIVSMILAPVAPIVAQEAGTPAPSGTPKPAPKKAPKPKAPPPARAAKPQPPDTAVDGGWPRGYKTPSGGKVIVYQPQVASWDDRKNMVAYAAVSYETLGAQKPAMGSIKLEAETKVSVTDRLVDFSNLRITESNFPTLAKEQMKEVVSEIQQTIPPEDRIIALDRVLSHLDSSQIMPRESSSEGVKADPPVIFYSDSPALLLNIDGEPIWSPIRDNDLKFAVNTNWDLFQHSQTEAFYLRNGNTWLTATDLNGPWTPAGKLPGSFKKLPADENWKEVKAAVPGKKIDKKKVPKVFVSQTPAEMILVNGKPAYLPVQGTSLMWVSNTDSDVFRVGDSGAVYYLVSGRWFSSLGFDGPWTFATPNLPADFQKIPLEHERSRVLASVPGSQQAAEAVLLAEVPQTARVNRKETKAPEVAYQGEPQFKPIEKTSVEMATNTDKDVLKVGDLYYLCFQGVWFMSTAATGPWEVASTVPKEIYEIPTSSPVHNVTYVTVVEDDDDEWVTFASVAAYTGVMVAWGCAVWGTGYYYPPYWGYGGYYPYYYPRYPSYGYGAWYNPWTGGYGRTAVAYGPYGGAGVTSRYNPRTGTYSRGAAAWGPYGARGYGEAYNPRTGAYGQTRQGSNVYGSWGRTSVQRGDQWATTSRYTSNRTGDTTRVTRTDSGAGAITKRGPGADSGIVRTGSGDVYAGRDGNIYRKQGDSWQQWDNGNWGDPTHPGAKDGTREAGAGNRESRADTREAGAGTRDVGAGTRESRSGSYSNRGSSTYDQLNRDSRSRSEGRQRTRDYSSYQRSGSSRSSSSYRSGNYSRGGSRGGYSRGGGGRGRR